MLPEGMEYVNACKKHKDGEHHVHPPNMYAEVAVYLAVHGDRGPAKYRIKDCNKPGISQMMDELGQTAADLAVEQSSTPASSRRQGSMDEGPASSAQARESSVGMTPKESAEELQLVGMTICECITLVPAPQSFPPTKFPDSH